MKPFEFIYERLLKEAKQKDFMKPGKPVSIDPVDYSQPDEQPPATTPPAMPLAKSAVKPAVAKPIAQPTIAPIKAKKPSLISKGISAAELNPTNLPYIFIDPMNKKEYSVTDMQDWNENFVDEYNELYSIDIPQYPEYEPIVKRHPDYFELQLDPEFVEQMRDYIKKPQVVKTPPEAVQDKNAESNDYTQNVKSFVQRYNMAGLKPKDFGTKSVISNKTDEFSNGSGNSNTLLKNNDDGHLVFQSYFTFPMIDDAQHQIVNNNSVLGAKLKQALFSVFKHPAPSTVVRDIDTQASSLNEDAAGKFVLPVFGAPEVQGVKSKTTDKVLFDKTTLDIQGVIAAISGAVDAAFAGKNIQIDPKTGLNIWWANPESMSKATEIALSHVVELPPQVNPRKQLETDDPEYKNYIIGWFDNNGIPVEISNLKKDLFKKFNINAITATLPGEYKGTGAAAEKAESKVKPNVALGMANTPDELTGQAALGAEYKGLTFTKPFQEVPARISATFKNEKAKKDKLLEVLKKTVGDSPSSPASFPVFIDNLTPAKTGLTVSSISTDFAEILHPMAIMKRNGVIDNGVLDAAETYLGTRDLSKCEIFFGDENTPVFDSLLMMPGGKQLMISSKKGAGMAAGYAGFGNAYRALEISVQSTPNKEVKKRFQDYERKGYGKLSEFMGLQSALANETKEEARQLATSMSGWPRQIADLIVRFKDTPASSPEKNKLAYELISDKYLNKPEFLDFCYFVLSSTNLVQVNTQYTEDKTTGDLSIDNFVATWPNELFDKVYFFYEEKPNKVLKFKIEIGGKTIDTNIDIGGQDFSNAKGRAQSNQKQTGLRFADAAKFVGKKIPGTKNIERWDFSDKANNFKDIAKGEGDLPWHAGVKDLYKNYNNIVNKIPNKLMQKVNAKKILKPLYDQMVELQRSIGNDPGRYSGIPMSTDQLLQKVQQMINGN